MNETIALRQLNYAIAHIREFKGDISVATLQVFLIVAANPGITSKDLMKKAGVTQSAVSRHMSILGEYAWTGGEGLNLIRSVEAPMDRRHKVSYLTTKGQALASKILVSMDPQGPEPDLGSHDDTDKEIKSLRRRGAR